MSHSDKLFIWGVAALTVLMLSPKPLQGVVFLFIAIIAIVFFVV